MYQRLTCQTESKGGTRLQQARRIVTYQRLTCQTESKGLRVLASNY